MIATNHSAFEGICSIGCPAGLLLVDPWNVSGSARVFAAVRAAPPPCGERPASSSPGGAGTIGARGRAPPGGRPGLGGARVRPAPGARLDARGVRGPHRRPARPRRRRARPLAGCTHVIHLAAIVGGIANFHKLPHTLLEVNNGLYNAVFRAALERARRAARLRVLVDGVRARDRVPDHRGAPRTTARPRARPTASRSSPARSTAARCTTSTACPFTICRPFNAYGPGEMPDDEPGIAHAVPDLIRKVLCGPAPACRSSARASRRARSRTWTTSPTASSRRWRTRPARTRTSTSRRPRS